MRMPAELSEAIQQETGAIPSPKLAQAAADLTQRYKRGDFSLPAISTPAHQAAYLAVRMPATFAANLRVFDEVRRLAPQAAIRSILDLGAGTGTSLYAAAETFSPLAAATMVEQDSSMVEIGCRISRRISHPAVLNSKWLTRDLKTDLALEPHDLVTVSYTLNELSPKASESLVARAWQSTRQLLVILDPGTVRGFEFVHAARSQLIAAGAHILAPCPHALACPMMAAGDWCHFAQRLERTSIHRRLKAGALGYEDEKFSYLVASRDPCSPVQSRIVRHPQKHSGHIQLLLCTPQGLEKRTVSKSQKEDYKLARKTEWGDRWRLTADSLLGLRGSGKDLWTDEHADEYARRLREGLE